MVGVGVEVADLSEASLSTPSVRPEKIPKWVRPGSLVYFQNGVGHETFIKEVRGDSVDLGLHGVMSISELLRDGMWVPSFQGRMERLGQVYVRGWGEGLHQRIQEPEEEFVPPVLWFLTGGSFDWHSDAVSRNPWVAVGNTLIYKGVSYRVLKVDEDFGLFSARNLRTGKVSQNLDWGLSEAWRRLSKWDEDFWSRLG